MKKLAIYLSAISSVFLFSSIYAAENNTIGNKVAFTAKNIVLAKLNIPFPYAWFYVKRSNTYQPCSKVPSIPIFINTGHSKKITFKSSGVNNKDRFVWVCLRYSFMTEDFPLPNPIKVKSGDTVSISQKIVDNQLKVTFEHNGKPIAQ